MAQAERPIDPAIIEALDIRPGVRAYQFDPIPYWHPDSLGILQIAGVNLYEAFIDGSSRPKTVDIPLINGGSVVFDLQNFPGERSDVPDEIVKLACKGNQPIDLGNHRHVQVREILKGFADAAEDEGDYQTVVNVIDLLTPGGVVNNHAWVAKMKMHVSQSQEFGMQLAQMIQNRLGPTQKPQ